jgi:hypothetical protein
MHNPRTVRRVEMKLKHFVEYIFETLTANKGGNAKEEEMPIKHLILNKKLPNQKICVEEFL